jgi:hypothetical protein
MTGMLRSGSLVKVAASAATATGLLLVTPLPAWAYIDPGSGSVAYQALLASALALTFLFRSTWSKVKKWFESREKP